MGGFSGVSQATLVLAEGRLCHVPAWSSEGCSAMCPCWPHCRSTCGWKWAGGTIALLQSMGEMWPLCPKVRAQSARIPAGCRTASAPGSRNRACLGHGKSMGEVDVGLRTFIACGDLLVPSFAGTSCEPLPGQSPSASPASCQVSSACSWQSRQLPLAQFFSVWFGLAHSKAVWDSVCCRMLPIEKCRGCMVLAAAG